MQELLEKDAKNRLIDYKRHLEFVTKKISIKVRFLDKQFSIKKIFDKKTVCLFLKKIEFWRPS
jgi:hypothetical protein